MPEPAAEARNPRSREAGVVTEMLVTKAEQLSDDGAFASGLASARWLVSLLCVERRDALPRRQNAA